MKELGVDKVIYYTKGNWYDEKYWQTSKFDCIIDCAVGVRAWNSCNSVLKNRRAGGRFVAVVHNDWHISGKHYSDVFGMLLPPFGRQLYNVVRCTTPKYLVYLNEPSKESMAEVMELAGGGGSKKVLKLVLDPESPHPFTTQGVRDAWNKHIARKGHGKIVISVA
jgi:NADPH:quinone reductase-like Zn-dependent oxidoreductase